MLPLWLGWPAIAIAQTPNPLTNPSANPLPEQTTDLSAAEANFSVHCAACHINGGNIIRRGKTLKQKALVRYGYGEVDAIAQLITQGKGVMPAFADKLSKEEIGAIAQYVQQQAATSW
jgi:cytochrome c6